MTENGSNYTHNNPAAELIPIGKYKGQPIEVLRGDPKYTNWLITGSDIRDSNPRFYSLIINNSGEPSETPEHNRLQKRFLDKHCCLGLLRLTCPDWLLGDLRGLLERRLELAKDCEHKAAVLFCRYLARWQRRYIEEGENGRYAEERVRRGLARIAEIWQVANRAECWASLWQESQQTSEAGESCGFGGHEFNRSHDSIWGLERFEAMRAKAIEQLVAYDRDWTKQLSPLELHIEFESNGWDVVVSATLPSLEVDPYVVDEKPDPILLQHHARALIEIKPALGEDFPAVLRQVKARWPFHHRGSSQVIAMAIEKKNAKDSVLVIERFHATSANLDQVRKIFGFPIVTIAEIEVQTQRY